MLRPSEIAKFLLRFALLYALSIAIWPLVGASYGAFYRSSVQTVIGLADREGKVVILPSQAPADDIAGPALDTHIVCRLPVEGKKGQTREFLSERSSRYSGYAPLALTLSLILATPLPWRRRGTAAFWGALLATWFVVLVPAFQIYPLYLTKEASVVFSSVPALYPLWHGFANALAKITRWVTLYYIVPHLIWVTLAFRREEILATIERVASRANRSEAEPD